MTQQEFDEEMKIAKVAHREAQHKLEVKQQRNKALFKAVKAEMVKLIEPASKKTKAKNETYSLQRHLKHEIERFCDGKVGLTSEGATVQFVADDAQVVFTIVVPKK